MSERAATLEGAALNETADGGGGDAEDGRSVPDFEGSLTHLRWSLIVHVGRNDERNCIDSLVLKRSHWLKPPPCDAHSDL